uniref:Uncharacterized protein n=1 Tax=Triticum urartu TaxID=4572 RepID=A0A8R7TW44_TRIUA
QLNHPLFSCFYAEALRIYNQLPKKAFTYYDAGAKHDLAAIFYTTHFVICYLFCCCSMFVNCASHVHQSG